MGGILQVPSLSEQVYVYLREEMVRGKLVPGSTINIGEIAKELGISKTPLRDALIHLELEGFVSILPRRGVVVNELSLSDVKKAYDSIGLIEAFIVEQGIDKITEAQIKKLEQLNNKMVRDINNNDFSTLFENNLEFHNVYIDISDNTPLKKFILPIKHRLYDFPRQNYLPDWELRNCEEHVQFINHLKEGNAQAAASVLKDKHWSFEYQQEFINTFYRFTSAAPA